MPCYDGPRAEDEVIALRKRLDELTDMMCAQYMVLERQHPDLIMFQAWWQEHKKKDAERAKLEGIRAESIKKREAAIAKLTLEERRLLGL